MYRKVLTALALLSLLAGAACHATDLEDKQKQLAKFEAQLARMQQERFYMPQGVAVDGAGNVYVLVPASFQVVKIDRAGRMQVLAGTPGQSGRADGEGASARFGGLWGIAADDAGKVYVADRDNNAIRVIAPGGRVSTRLALAAEGEHYDDGWRKAHFPGLSAITLDKAGNIYVVDSFGSVVSELNLAGVVRDIAGAAGDIAGTARNTAGVPGYADGEAAQAAFSGAMGIAADGAGNLYVADGRNCVIRKITPDRMVSTLAGSAGSCGHADGLGAAARFAYPWGIATDDGGNIYVSDADSHTIRKITPEGLVSTLAGSPGVQGKADGPGAQATFFAVRGIAVDQAGNIYVADSGNLSIRKITPDGHVSTLAYLPKLNDMPR